jgi:hypothetical protein
LSSWTIFDLQCEELVYALGISNSKPRFTWQIKGGEWNSKYFKVRASTTLEKLKSGKADLWDSELKKLYLPMIS